jgi:hypothetical protein
MKSLYEPEARKALLARLDALKPESVRQWGKMDPAQMLSHCANAMEVAVGDRTKKQALLGKVLMPFFRKAILGEKPFARNAPTDPSFVIRDPRDFEAEKRRLLALIDRFVAAGPEKAGNYVHSFFGKMTGQEWGELMHKHFDHHLQQFGV